MHAASMPWPPHVQGVPIQSNRNFGFRKESQTLKRMALIVIKSAVGGSVLQTVWAVWAAGHFCRQRCRHFVHDKTEEKQSLSNNLKKKMFTVVHINRMHL